MPVFCQLSRPVGRFRTHADRHKHHRAVRQPVRSPRSSGRPSSAHAPSSGDASARDLHGHGADVTTPAPLPRRSSATTLEWAASPNQLCHHTEGPLPGQRGLLLSARQADPSAGDMDLEPALLVFPAKPPKPPDLREEGAQASRKVRASQRSQTGPDQSRGSQTGPDQSQKPPPAMRFSSSPAQPESGSDPPCSNAHQRPPPSPGIVTRSPSP